MTTDNSVARRKNLRTSHMICNKNTAHTPGQNIIQLLDMFNLFLSAFKTVLIMRMMGATQFNNLNKGLSANIIFSSWLLTMSRHSSITFNHIQQQL